MEQIKETKIITIKDLDNDLKFSIKLFNVIEGLNFLDEVANLIKTNDKFTILPFLGQLLKLATPLNNNNEPTISGYFDIEKANVLIKNPLTLIELGMEILNFQKVFIKSSKKFQELIKPVEDLLHIRISE